MRHETEGLSRDLVGCKVQPTTRYRAHAGRGPRWYTKSAKQPHAKASTGWSAKNSRNNPMQSKFAE
jgi:hypothetical protein